MREARREMERGVPNTAVLRQPFAFSFFLVQWSKTVYPKTEARTNLVIIQWSLNYTLTENTRIILVFLEKL